MTLAMIIPTGISQSMETIKGFVNGLMRRIISTYSFTMVRPAFQIQKQGKRIKTRYRKVVYCDCYGLEF